MPVSGDLATLDVADLLGWIQVRAKTGHLLLGRGATEKRLRFDAGRLTSSTSNDPRETLGQALVRDQLVSEEALFGALLRQERERRVSRLIEPSVRPAAARATMARSTASPAPSADSTLKRTFKEGSRRRSSAHCSRRCRPSSITRPTSMSRQNGSGDGAA